MKIVVSNPGKQHVHQLLEGLNVFANPVFVTSYWWQARKWRYRIISLMPRRLRERLMLQLRKRYHPPIEGILIFEFPGPELRRLFRLAILKNNDMEAITFERERAFDKKVAAKLSAWHPEIVIGYEMACLETFKKAKRLGATTVLDLAQIHYKEIDVLGKRFPVLGTLFENRRLRDKINRVKEEELQLADCILCLSDFAMESLHRHGVPEHKIVKVNLGFAPQVFLAKSEYRKSGLFRFVFVGTITRRKGIDLLTRAFQELDLPDSELMLIGPLTDAEEMLPQDDPRIRHIAHVPQERLNDLLNASDLFVFPSYLDSWAMVVVEAMACGLQVIVSTYTGASDVVRKGGGDVIEPALELLKERMRARYENREETERLGREARAIAESYTWETYHREVKKVLSRLKVK